MSSKVTLPQVDMGVTLLIGSDRYPGTIIEMFKEKSKEYLVVQEDDSIRIDKNGFSEDQDYDYSPNPNGRTYTYRKEKNERWKLVEKNKETNRWNKSSGYSLYIGVREKYHDFSF